MTVLALRVSYLAARGLGACAAAAAFAAPAQGADFPIGLRNADRGAIELSRQPSGETAFTAAAGRAPQISKAITVGLAHENDEDGSHALTTPFLFDYRNNRWEFLLSGDGFTRAVSDGKTASGLADLAAVAQYAVSLAPNWIVLPGLGLGVPVGGHVGSRHLSEVGQLLTVVSPTEKWTLGAGGIVSRSGGSPPGVNSYGTALLAKAQYKIDDDRAAIVSFKRGYKRGAGGGSVVAAEFDFPFFFKRPAALVAAQGLSRGKRNTAIEFDIQF